MYPRLFGVSALITYDLLGVLGYGIVIWYLLHPKTRPARAEGEDRVTLRVLVPLLVHLVAYTFGGELLGSVIQRGTEFYGYVAVSAVGMTLAAITLGGRPLVWLDRTVPLYLTVASALKLSCFCAGCCGGLPWAYGLYNHQTNRCEFPIQLVEMVAYALLLWVLSRYRSSEGRRFALFLAVYAAFRFGVQFFRSDMPTFSVFHWLSVAVCAVGVALWLICGRRMDEKCTNVG